MDNVFFIVSKIAWGLLSPVSLMVWLTAFATLLLIFNRIKTGRRLLLLISIVSLTVLAYPVGDFLMTPLESRFAKPTRLSPQIDGIIVLGGGEELKLSASWQTAEMGNGGDRYIGAGYLAKQYPNVPVIFTGGSNLLQMPDITVTEQVARQLLAAVGIAEERMVIETQSRNTHENFVFIKPLLPKADGRYLLVTSAFHMARAVGVARKQQIDVVAYPVDYRSGKPAFRQWDFALFEHLQVLEPAWREWIGLTVYFLTGKTSAWFPAVNTVVDNTDVTAGLR